MRLLKTGACFLFAIVLTACVTTPVKNSSSQANKHLKAAAISAAAYNQNPKTRLSLLSEQQLTEVTYIGLRETSADNLTTEYLVAEKDGTLFISFTGSNAKNDWLRNLNAQYKPYQNMPYPIHKGFVLSWEEVQTDIMALIREKKPSSVALSGHSKGGAVASVAALKLLMEGVAVSEVTTFGAPPIFKIPRDESDANFDAKLASSTALKRLDDVSTHYIREYDYIQLASTGLAMNKRGLGTQLSLKDDGSIYSDTNRLGAAMGLVTNISAAKVTKFDSTALHHHASTYLEILKKAK